MRFLLFFILFFSANICFAQRPIPGYGYQKPYLGMKGKVKTMTEEVYDIIQKDDNTQDKKLKETIIYNFDKEGKLIDWIKYDQIDTITTVFKEYNDKIPIRIESTTHTSNSVRKDSVHLFTLSPEYELLVGWRNYDQKEASYTDSTLINYYPQSMEITVLGKKPRTRMMERYDEKCNLIEVSYSLDYDIKYLTNQTFNEDNLLTEVEIINGHNYSAIYYLYSYNKFDKKGNWRECTTNYKTMNSDNKTVIEIKERNIKYY